MFLLWMVAFILHVVFRSETQQNLLPDFNHLLLCAFVLVIETEELEGHSPTELLFVVKKLSDKNSNMSEDTDTIFPS